MVHPGLENRPLKDPSNLFRGHALIATEAKGISHTILGEDRARLREGIPFRHIVDRVAQLCEEILRGAKATRELRFQRRGAGRIE